MEAATQLAVDRLLAWFEVEGRDWPWRRTRERWPILVSEVCLQQTQVQRAAAKIEQLLDAFPTPDAMAGAPLGAVLELWQGLGYPRRARNLWLAAQQIAEAGWPDDYRTLPGVGPYTAAALQCFADERPVVPPDINTRRVLARLFPDGPPTHERLPVLATRAWSWGQAVMELGQRHCRARALCDECPLASMCPSAGTVDVIASPRQRAYEGSFRQRRGALLRRLTRREPVPVEDDREAALSLVADGLALLDEQLGVLTPP